jgi:hypothetical protein
VAFADSGNGITHGDVSIVIFEKKTAENLTVIITSSP